MAVKKKSDYVLSPMVMEMILSNLIISQISKNKDAYGDLKGFSVHLIYEKYEGDIQLNPIISCDTSE